MRQTISHFWKDGFVKHLYGEHSFAYCSGVNFEGVSYGTYYTIHFQVERVGPMTCCQLQLWCKRSMRRTELAVPTYMGAPGSVAPPFFLDRIYSHVRRLG